MSWRTILLSVVAAAAVSWLLWVAFDYAQELDSLRPMINKHQTVFQLVVFLLLLVGFYLYFTPIKIDDE